MARIKICSPERSDAATLTASQEVAGMVVSNLQSLPPTDVWRTADIAGAYVVADLGAAYAIDVVGMLYTNATSAATARVRGADTEANLTAAPGYDSGTVNHRPVDASALWGRSPFLHFPTTAQSYRWWRVDIADAANGDGYYQAGRLYLSSAWVPSVNAQYGWDMVFVDAAGIDRVAGGAGIPREVGRFRQMRFNLDFLEEAEIYDNAFRLDRLRGTAKDVLVVMDSDDTARLLDQTIYGVLRGLRPIVNTAFSVFQKGYVIEELELP